MCEYVCVLHDKRSHKKSASLIVYGYARMYVFVCVCFFVSLEWLAHLFQYEVGKP